MTLIRRSWRGTCSIWHRSERRRTSASAAGRAEWSPRQGAHDSDAAYPAISELRGVPVRRDQPQSRRATAQLGRTAANAVPSMRQAIRVRSRQSYRTTPDETEDGSGTLAGDVLTCRDETR